jgi:hypothetical protein
MTLILKTAIQVAPVQSRWRRSSLAETDASDHASAACYRCSEHVGIAAVVIPELKFRDVQRQVLGADFVECADYAALEDAPKAFNRVGVNRADNIFMVGVPGDLMPVAIDLAKPVVANPLVRDQQAHLLGNRLSDELAEKVAAHALDNAGDNIPLPLDSADNRHFTRTEAATARLAASFAVVLVLGFAADERFVNLDNATKLSFRGDQCGADFVTHQVCGFIASKAHHALDLQGADTFLACEHVVGDAIPITKRLFGILKDRARDGRKSIALRRALAALPVKWLVARSVVQVRVAATGTANTFRPAAGHKVAQAGLLIAFWEARLKLRNGHLRDWLRSLCHGSTLSMEGDCHG